MTNITQEEESRIALLGLLATKGEKVGARPSDETLATFLEGKLAGQPSHGRLEGPSTPSASGPAPNQRTSTC